MMRPWFEHAVATAPGVSLFDIHTHTGSNDPDGFRSYADDVVATLAAAGSRGMVTPMHEPEGYPPANDRVIEESVASGGRLVAFCRLDPKRDALAEAARCFDAGARGIKLHPRAEGFPLDTPELEGVFALANERRLPVLVHAGRGIPALGRHALAVCERHPDLRLILAHAGICDLAWIWREVESHPNLFFDTAWWSPSDLLSLWALLPPRHVLFASDAPYSSPTFAAMLNLRYALQVGLGEEALRLAFGGQMARLVTGEEPLDAGPAPGADQVPRDLLLDRVHTFLVAAVGQMFTGNDAAEVTQLAALACEVGEDAPQAETCQAVLRMLEIREEMVASGDNGGRPARFAPGLAAVVIAAGLTRTPGVPMPAAGKPHTGVGERSL